MKKIKGFRFITIMILMILLSTACGKKSFESTANSSYDSVAPATVGKADYGTSADGLSSDWTTEEATGDSAVLQPENQVSNGTVTATTTSTTQTQGQTQTQDKIIKNYYLNVETQDFDALVTKVDTKINELGGYTENSQIGGKSLYDSNVSRNGSIIARIPSEKANDFVKTIKENANVVNNQQTTENVSLKYIDAESRIKALEMEQERLYTILDTATNLDNILTLETRLSEIRYELENYKSQIRMYDNQVNYSTITLNIQEVERITPVKEVKQTYLTRIQNGFGDTMYHISNGFQNFSIWFIVNIPYFLIWGVLIFIIVWITRRFMKKHVKAAATVNNSSLYSKLKDSEDTNNNNNMQ